MTTSRDQARFRLIETIWPAYYLVEREKSLARRGRYDFEAARQRFISRVTGEDGVTLEQGGPLSIPTTQELNGSIQNLVRELETSPESYGVQLFSGEPEEDDD